MNTIQFDFTRPQNMILLGGNADSRRSLLQGMIKTAKAQKVTLLPVKSLLSKLVEGCDSRFEFDGFIPSNDRTALLVLDDSAFDWDDSILVDRIARCFAAGLLYGVRVLLSVSKLDDFANFCSHRRILQNASYRFMGQLQNQQEVERIESLLPISPLVVGTLLNHHPLNPEWYFLGVSGNLFCSHKTVSPNSDPALIFE